MKICRGNPNAVKTLTEISGTLHEDQHDFHTVSSDNINTATIQTTKCFASMATLSEFITFLTAKCYLNFTKGKPCCVSVAKNGMRSSTTVRHTHSAYLAASHIQS